MNIYIYKAAPSINVICFSIYTYICICLRPKGRGRKLVGQGEMCMREYVARPFECHFLIRNELPFDVADLLTAAYHDLLARMHHSHSTTLPLTS